MTICWSQSTHTIKKTSESFKELHRIESKDGVAISNTNLEDDESNADSDYDAEIAVNGIHNLRVAALQ